MQKNLFHKYDNFNTMNPIQNLLDLKRDRRHLQLAVCFYQIECPQPISKQETSIKKLQNQFGSTLKKNKKKNKAHIYIH